MRHDYKQLARDELASWREFLPTLSDEQWDAPSLLSGWKVRHVVGHLALGRIVPLPKVLALLARYRFDMDKLSLEKSIEIGDGYDREELIEIFNRETSRPRERGLAGVEPPAEKLADNLTHQQDVRRPLGLPRQIPEARLVGVLDAVPRNGMVNKTKQRVAGLRLEADDVGWSSGDGPLVRGAGEALVMAAEGRSVALDELSGDGVATLAARIPA